MVKRLVTLAGVCATMTLAQKEQSTQPTILDEVNDKGMDTPYWQNGDTKLRHMIQYFVFALKGSILGFQQGLLDDERIRLSDSCFGSN